MNLKEGDEVKFVGAKTDHGRGDFDDVLENGEIGTVDNVRITEKENWVTIGVWDYTFNEVEKLNTNNATDKQVGGSWYQELEIQPIEFVMNNEDSLHPTDAFMLNNVLKYCLRHRQKGGEEDLEKAIHYISLVLEHEYND